VLILGNRKFLSKLSNIPQAFRQDVFFSYEDAYYRPLLTISFILDAQLPFALYPSPKPSPQRGEGRVRGRGQGKGFSYHFTNIVIHLLAACLLFLLLIKLKYREGLALFFSLIFTVHPVLTQAVAWLPGRNDSLLAVFILSSFIFFLNFLENKRWSHYIAHMLFFALALFTKESALALVLLCPLVYVIASPPKAGEAISMGLLRRPSLRLGFLAMTVAGYLPVIAVWLFLRNAALTNPIQMTVLSAGKSLLNNLPALVQFVGKIIFPFNLSVLPIIQDTTFVYGVIAITLTLIALIFTKNKRNSFIIFGLAWFLLFLLPSFIRPNSSVIADFLEHRIYLPLVGFMIILLETDLIKNLYVNRKRLLIPGALFIFIFSFITLNHSKNFRDRLSFWQNAALTSPHSPLARRNLGAMYYLDGELNKAEQEYRASLELNPYEPMAHNNLGLIYLKRGELNKAEQEYKREIAINPRYDDVYFNLGLLYYIQGRIEEAEEAWKKALEINPSHKDIARIRDSKKI
ncbi:MAG: tetratricopeptide repeat protein, partial [Candidatus Omnitrophota bacterium]